MKLNYGKRPLHDMKETWGDLHTMHLIYITGVCVNVLCEKGEDGKQYSFYSYKHTRFGLSVSVSVEALSDLPLF